MPWGPIADRAGPILVGVTSCVPLGFGTLRVENGGAGNVGAG